MNKAKGNMYADVTHTHNVIKGTCPHMCSYCYMNKLYKRGWQEKKPLYLDEKELKKKLGKGNIIFIGSSCDMWADIVPGDWIVRTLSQTLKYWDNKYIFQSKNPKRIKELCGYLPPNCDVGTTVETNRVYPCMGNVPEPIDRCKAVGVMRKNKRFITIEPILDFDLEPFVAMLKVANPDYINIGADTGNNRLPEPEPEKIRDLLFEIGTFTKVNIKKNLTRLMPGYEA